MRSWRRQAAVVAGATALVLGVPAVAAAPSDDGPTRTLNAPGGASGEGLRVAYGSGQLEVVLDGQHQLATGGVEAGARLAAGNHFALAVGSTVVSDVLAAAAPGPGHLAWETISTSQSYGTIFSTFTPPEQLAGFSLFVTVSYTRPGDEVSVRARVGVPDGVAGPVRLYWVGESTLVGATPYVLPEVPLVGAFAPLGTTPPAYRALTAEPGLRQPYQYLVGPAACPYEAGVAGCTAGSGFVAANTDLPDAIAPVGDGHAALAVEFGPLPAGRSDVGFELGFRTLGEPPVEPPPTTTVPEDTTTTTVAPDGTTTTTVPGGTTPTTPPGDTTTSVPDGTPPTAPPLPGPPGVLPPPDLFPPPLPPSRPPGVPPTVTTTAVTAPPGPS